MRNAMDISRLSYTKKVPDKEVIPVRQQIVQSKEQVIPDKKQKRHLRLNI